MKYYEVGILSGIDVFMIVFISLITRNTMTRKYIIKGCIGIGVGVFMSMVIDIWIVNQSLAVSMNLCLGILIVKYVMAKPLRDLFMTYAYSTTLAAILSLVVTLSLSQIFNDFAYTFKYGIIAQITTAFIVLNIARISFLKRFYIILLDKRGWLGFLVTIIFAVNYGLIILWHTDLQGFLASAFGILLIIVIILLIYTLMMTSGYKHQLMEQKLEMYEVYSPMIKSIIEEMRAKQHDYHNHIQVLEELNRTGKQIELERYSRKLKEDGIWTELIKLDNEILMAFLYRKYVEVEKLGIVLEYQINNLLFETGMSDYDLIEMFGIVFDNAIKEVSGLEKKQIELIIEYKEKMNVLIMKNTYNQTKPMDVGKVFSREYSPDIGKQHGYGLKKLSSIIKRQNGSITVECIKDKIVFTIEIPTLLK